MTEKIEGTTEAWESGQLGQDEDFVQPVDIKDSIIDEALELQMISIRLQKSLLEDLKMIASYHGVGYQPLMKQILRRFVDCEKKKLLREYAAEQAKNMKAEAAAEAEKESNEAKQAC